MLLDSKEAKPARPSLFNEGKPGAGDAAQPRQHITTTLDADPQARKRGGDARRRPRAGIVLGIAALLVVGAGLLWWQVSPEGGHAPGPRPVRPVESTAPVASAPAESSGSSAVLVSAPDASDASAADDPMSVIRANAARSAAAAETEPVRSPAAAVATNRPTAPPAARARPDSPLSKLGAPASGGSRMASGRSGTTPARTGEQDLLATLLANIRERPMASASAQPQAQTLDELIAQLLKQDPPATTGAATTPAQDQSSAKLQTRLRACPPPNTLDGIRCRQKLCASYAGDPACPRQ